jgi:hypothetical protein
MGAGESWRLFFALSYFLQNLFNWRKDEAKRIETHQPRCKVERFNIHENTVQL